MPQKKQSVYSKIAEDLTGKIKSGVYTVGGMLPPERELMEIYNVERTTIRRGLELLSRDGYIRKVAGLGSVILSDKAMPLQSEDNTDTDAASYKQAAVNQKSSSILALFPNKNSFSAISEAVIEQLNLICKKNAAKLTVLSSSDEEEILVTARKAKADSCAVFYEADEKLLSLLKAEGICILRVFCKAKGFRSILPDIYGASDAAAEYLTSLGHKVCAFIGGDEDSYLQREYRLGFIDEFNKRNPESDIKQYTNTGGSDEKSGFERLSELIRRAGGKFTAVAAINDEVAAGALKAAKYYRLSVPEDISIISLCSTNQDSQVDSIYTNPVHIAAEIFNFCAGISDSSFGITSLCDYDLQLGKTCAKAKNSGSSARKMSDFLL